MKIQTAFANHLFAPVYYSQSFFKTITYTLLLLACAFILTHQAAAQTRNITSTVKASTGKSLPAASILVKTIKKCTGKTYLYESGNTISNVTSSYR